GLVARIAGVDLPRDKRVVIALTYIYGIGRTRAETIVKSTGINPDTRVRDLTEEEINRLREFIDKNYTVEGDLRREVQNNIKRLIDIGCYRGLRHRRGLPVGGQRTRTHARTPVGAETIVKSTGINPDTRVRDLTEEEINRLREFIDKNYTVEGDLRREVQNNIKRLIDIGCYRGLRHRRGLPVRGQRTRTNARTRKGPRRTVAGKKKKTKA